MLRHILVTLLVALIPAVSFCQYLKEAISKKDTVAAATLIKKGADVNVLDEYGASFLMTSCRWSETDMVSFLLRHGATADKPKSAKGRTPLIIACAYYAGKAVCSMLIEKGADVNAAANDGTTALMMAASNAKLDVVELLLKKGANARAKDANGQTALDYAKKADVSDYLTKSVKDTRLDKAGVIKMLEGQ